MLGSLVGISGYFALGRAGLTGLPRDFGGYAGVGANAHSGPLLDGTASALRALDDGRGGVDGIKSALMKLRAALLAARDQVGVVPGRTELKPVVADIEQTTDRPTFVTINGQPVRSGTVTVSLGTRPVVVGYERANRAPLEVAGTLKSLASTVATLVSSVGADGTGGFVADVSALLRSSEFTTAVNTPDALAIEAATARIDDIMAKTDGLRLSIGVRASAAAQVDLGGLLLSATGQSASDATAPASPSRDSLYRLNSSSPTGGQVSSWA